MNIYKERDGVTYMDMKKWVQEVIDSPVKKAVPVLSFPCVQLLGVGVKDLIMSSDLQAKGMKMIADRLNTSASVSMMDLSVEAEAFGSQVRFSDDEVPTVIGSIINDEEDAEQLQIPEIGAGRTGLYIEAIEKACKLITDRPILAGVIGPFTLAGRLMDVSEIMYFCFDEPDMVHTVLNKVTDYLIDYMKAYKAVGAHGVVVAEPLAGLLTPALNEEFSAEYMKRIVDEIQTDDFIVVYHNCGDAAVHMIDDIAYMGAAAYHFGNTIDMVKMLEGLPTDALVMGNIDPASQFCNGTTESIKKDTMKLLEACHMYPNFVISSGCDIPPMSNWDNIDAFFETVDAFYANK